MGGKHLTAKYIEKRGEGNSKQSSPDMINKEIRNRTLADGLYRMTFLIITTFSMYIINK